MQPAMHESAQRVSFGAGSGSRRTGAEMAGLGRRARTRCGVVEPVARARSRELLSCQQLLDRVCEVAVDPMVILLVNDDIVGAPVQDAQALPQRRRLSACRDRPRSVGVRLAGRRWQRGPGEGAGAAAAARRGAPLPGREVAPRLRASWCTSVPGRGRGRPVRECFCVHC